MNCTLHCIQDQISNFTINILYFFKLNFDFSMNLKLFDFTFGEQ